MTATYSEESIRTLDWKEHVRKRPGMYIGKLGDGSLRDDGIYKTIISKNETKLLYSFEDIISIHYNDTMEQAQHLVNHIMISPNGTKFMFIHVSLFLNSNEERVFFE